MSKSKVAGALCSKCTLREKQFVSTTGDPDALIAIVGEAPGREEVLKGEPMVGRSGQLLNTVLERLGVSRESLLITNSVQCRPDENRDPTPEEVECCRPRLAREVARAQRVIPMGSVALKAVLPGWSKSITASRGRLVVPEGGSQEVFPTWHPAFILRNPKSAPEWIRDLEKGLDLGVGTRKLPRVKKTIPQSPKEALSVIQRLLKSKGPLVLDIESEGYDWVESKLLCLALAQDAKEAIVFPMSVFKSGGVFQAFKKLVLGRPLIGHNFKFDGKFLLTQMELPVKVTDDTMLMHYALDERTGTHDLKKLASEFFGAPDWEGEITKYLKKKSDSYALVPIDVLTNYACYDVYYTWKLYEMLKKQLEKYPSIEKLYRELLIPLSNSWSGVELRGIGFDQKHVGVFKATLETRAAKMLKELRKIAKSPEFNPASVIQVRKVLYETLGLPTQYVDGKVSTREQTLQGLQLSYPNPFLDLLLEYRHVQKTISTYAEGMVDVVKGDGRVHTSILLHGTVTGRLASKEPSLMNIPRSTTEEGKMVRDSFIPSPGMVFVQADYRSAELRVLAYYTQDETLLSVLNRPGADIHSEVTSMVFGDNFKKDDRTLVKSIVFGLAYGRHPKSIAEMLHIPVEVATRYAQKTMAYMPGVKSWQRQVLQEAKSQGYLETVTGRRRRLAMGSEEEWNEVENQFLNFKIQSTASDLTQMSFVRLKPQIEKLGGFLLLTMHDAILMEVPKGKVKEAIRLLETTMVAVPHEVLGDTIRFEVETQVGKTWGSLETVKK